MLSALNEAPEEVAETDEELARRILTGEAHLFVHLMRRHNRRLFRVARSIVRNDGEAEDVLQDTYVRAFAHLGDFEARSRLRAWLVRIAVHESLARVRRANKHVSFDVEDSESSFMRSSSPPSPPGPERAATERELRGILERAIDQLPDAYRTVFVLRAVEELSVAETAESLSITEQSVKTRFFRARGQLQALLAHRFEALAPRAYEFAGARCDRVVLNVMQRLLPMPSREGSS